MPDYMPPSGETGGTPATIQRISSGLLIYDLRNGIQRSEDLPDYCQSDLLAYHSMIRQQFIATQKCHAEINDLTWPVSHDAETVQA